MLESANTSKKSLPKEDTKTASNPDGVTKEEEGREGFTNNLEFILTCMGLAVGLGNIWRFPSMAYENGGSAFLIPYLTCAILFGLPAIYMELLIGQYHGVSPPVIFRRTMPILEGVGWMGPMVSACVGVYYIVIISWITLYLYYICLGHVDRWTHCGNSWNNATTCTDNDMARKCAAAAKMTTTVASANVTTDPADQLRCGDQYTWAIEEYFNNQIINKSDGMLEIGGVNWQILVAQTVCWILTCLLILKGMKIMGKISYVTVILPYIIIVILFIRGVTLDGAENGLYYYFGKPDFGKLLTVKTWTAAIKQMCFSVAIGHGGLMSMASYSPKRNNCFKDACIVILFDTAMSIIGGAAVFSTLGFLAKVRNEDISNVVKSGQALAFIVYPEAISHMPLPILWSVLFFVMLFLLGVSTEIALVECFCSCLYDQFKFLRNKKHIVAPLWCLTLYLVGLIFSSKAGYFWFEMFDEYAAGFSSVCTVLVEIIVIMYLYSWRNFRDDINEVMGEARNVVTKFLGPHSPYYIANWLVASPLIGAFLIGLSIFGRDYPFRDGYPMTFDIFGWILSFIPVFMIPLFALVNWIKFRNRKYNTAALFKLQKQHASFPRINATWPPEKQQLAEQMLPDLEPWDEIQGQLPSASAE